MNDIFGATKIEWNKSVWESDLEYGLRTLRSAVDTHAITSHFAIVNCDGQVEIDRLWDALSAGGVIEQCGWLKDRFELYWQIVPTVLGEMMTDPDLDRSRRVMEALLGMRKLDIAGLERAYNGA